MVMNQDNTMSHVYKTFLEDVKDSSEKEMNDLKELHQKFDDIYDEEKMNDKLDTRWYNLNQIDNNEDMNLTTDFTSEAEDLTYKRYKMTQYHISQSVHEYAEMIEDL
jgi:hypothetical protein